MSAGQVEELMLELQDLEGQLKDMSDPDGTKRIPLSLDRLPQPLPQHAVEPGLHVINAYVRGADGSIATKWLRRVARTPVRVQALWGKHSLLLSVETRHAVQLVNTWGRHGCEARVLALRVVRPRPYPRPGDRVRREDGEEEQVPDSEVLGLIRVKPKQVHMMPTSNQIENIDMVFCPQDKPVKVNVPIKLVNDDVAPGVKAGGWVHLERRTVAIQVRGDEVPPYLEVDCKDLKLHGTIRARDVPLPASGKLVVSRRQPPFGIVARCTTTTGSS